jgi:hypothetical protein
LDALPLGLTETVRDVLNRNADAVLARMQFAAHACVHHGQVGSPPPCNTEEAEGTVVEGFVIYGCDGGYARRDSAATFVRGLVDQPLKLSAVYQPTRQMDPPEQYELLFMRTDAAARRLGIRLGAQTDGSIVSAGESCGTVETAVTGVTDFVIPPR